MVDCGNVFVDCWMIVVDCGNVLVHSQDCRG